LKGRLWCRYSLDGKAREWAGDLSGRPGYRDLPLAGKLFVALPFMHGETLEDQQVPATFDFGVALDLPSTLAS
jgi:uncharacterized protein (DUF924 family)